MHEFLHFMVDADGIAYRCAATCDVVSYSIGGQERKYHKEIKAVAEELGLPLSQIEKKTKALPVEECYKRITLWFEGFLDKLGQSCKDYDMTLFFTGKSNYRYKVNPFYKANRINKPTPTHLAAAKDFLKTLWDYVEDPDLEADDLVAMATSSYTGHGLPVIASNDKDLAQITMPEYDAVLHFDWSKQIDYAWSSVSAVDARYLLWKQVVTGDSTDNIHSPKGLGKVAAENLFADVDFEEVSTESLFELMVECYKTKLPKCSTEDLLTWVEQVYWQVRLLHSKEEYDQVVERYNLGGN